MKIGQKLFQALLSDCINNDMQSLLVWVVTNNPSKKFYEKFTPEKIDTKFLERVRVEETAYCWRDLNLLQNKQLYRFIHIIILCKHIIGKVYLIWCTFY